MPPAGQIHKMWDNGRIFVASAGFLLDCLFVFPLYRMSPISDAAQSTLTVRGEERKRSGGTVTTHYKLMRESIVEFLCRIKFPEGPVMS